MILRNLTISLCFMAGGVPGAEAPKAADPEASSKKLFKLFGEISRNMETIEKMLNKEKSDTACQKKQQELVSQIDKLVEELKKRQ